MNIEKYSIGTVVGYVLKIIKTGKKVTKFKKEFTFLKHGNYPKFIKSMNGNVPEIVMGTLEQIEVNPKPKAENIDFVGLFMAGPSLKDFYQKCFDEYGEFIDNEISDDLYYEIGMFEITIRIHANIYKKIEENHSLEQIINDLGEHLGLTANEKNTLQKARKLLNAIKHGKKKNYSWFEGTNDFKKALKIMDQRQIVL